MTHPEGHTQADDKAGLFLTTRWSVVRAAGMAAGSTAEEALEWLCSRYWFPLYVYVRGRGRPPAEAEDLVQGFFARVLERDIFAKADMQRGTFRTFLLGCLNHYLTDEYRRTQATKRGGGLPLVSLHDDGAEDWLQRDVPGGRTPEQNYDRAWALAMLDRVVERLQRECDADGKPGRFTILRPFLDGDRGETPLATAAEQLGITLAAVKSIIHRLRARMRELIRAEIRQTVETDAEVDGELRAIFSALRA